MSKNVLILMIDALRADRAWGASRSCKTPNLDRLVSQSTIFKNAFSTSSMTPVCTASILTGSYPFVHGIREMVGQPLRSNMPTLAGAFRRNGYFTWAEVTGPLLSSTGLNYGFQDYKVRDFKEWMDTSWGDQLIARLKSGQENPWFGFVHLWELHRPRRVAQEFDSSRYGSSAYDRALSSLDQQLGRLLEAIPENTILVVTGDHGEHVSTQKSGEAIARLKPYYKWLKRKLPIFKKVTRISPKIIESMDAGNNDLQFEILGHGFHVYEYLVRVPLILYGPGLFPSGLEIAKMVSHVDIFPTLVTALDLREVDTTYVSGVDLTPLVRGQDSVNGRALYLELNRPRTGAHPDLSIKGLRTEQHKFVFGSRAGSPLEELFDLKKDPQERHNIAALEPQITQSLRSQVTGLIETAPLPQAEEQAAYTAEELAVLEERLRDLGYME